MAFIDPKTIDDIARRIGESLPGGVRELGEDLEKSIRSSLQIAFQKMDLVTREELEVQSALLQRTRERLEMLEQRVATLEARSVSGTAGPEISSPEI